MTPSHTFHSFRFTQPVENSSLFPPDISKLSVIKDRLPNHVTYGHIKLVIAILEMSCQTASCSTAVTPQRKVSFTSSAPPAKAPSNSRSSSQDTARKLPVWLSGKPGGKRKNPFWIEKANSKLLPSFLCCVQTSFPILQLVDGTFRLLVKVTMRGRRLNLVPMVLSFNLGTQVSADHNGISRRAPSSPAIVVDG